MSFPSLDSISDEELKSADTICAYHPTGPVRHLQLWCRPSVPPSTPYGKPTPSTSNKMVNFLLDLDDHDALQVVLRRIECACGSLPEIVANLKDDDDMN